MLFWVDGSGVFAEVIEQTLPEGGQPKLIILFLCPLDFGSCLYGNMIVFRLPL